jgi:hypothetical protein
MKRVFLSAVAFLIGGILLLIAYDTMGHPRLSQILDRRTVISSGGSSFDGRLVVGPIAGIGLLFLGGGVYLLVAKEDDPK